jgi:RNA polymerase-binding transcription factor DksA
MSKPAPKKSASAPAAKKAAPKAAAKKATAKAAPAPKKDDEKVPAAKRAPTGSPFDAKFLEGQRLLLLEERAKLLGQAESLEGEAASLMEDLDPGDVQFDDESGEGDSLVVERERDLALSAQARQMISDIDAALGRLRDGTYGFSVHSGRPIPKDRLRAIPWATELVEEKVGGLGTRR